MNVRCATLAAALCVAAAAGPLRAQTYPSRAVRLLVPTTPGGSLDTLARIVAQRLAVTGPKRSPALPQLPTMSETGVPGYASSTWYGVVAPRGTPAEIVDRLAQEIATLLAQPETRERIAAEGAEPVGSPPREFSAFIAAEIAKWSKVVAAAGVRGG